LSLTQCRQAKDSDEQSATEEFFHGALALSDLKVAF
jgi:hypothetical protein